MLIIGADKRKGDAVRSPVKKDMVSYDISFLYYWIKNHGILKRLVPVL
jgi:hypothetical protein